MKPTWYYNEMVSRGTDYTDLNKVQEYDEKMKKIRDIEGECNEIIDSLALSGEENVLEFGAATGEFALRASHHCKAFYAVDVSPAMLAYARIKADCKDLQNIRFFNAGFLTYNHTGPPLDAVVSQLTLHHLPDFWKEVALSRVFSVLKPGGQFFLKDTVYSFNPAEHIQFFSNWIEETCRVDPQIAIEVETHIREEFSTTAPVMEEILARAGFIIERAEYPDGYLATYVCKKPAE
ncbi:MAG: class I SAM-dependent methyltransferase [Bacillota bacterium]|nr:class I SAM-dependent methyltransferase [Bacillota bacterium]MDW7682909.1 class I SAM-dependent methyltransferase [Bacillota bacterium]